MATGMITRHFDHPSGATATLEMPAGWSRNSYYVMTLQRTNGEHGVAPERVTCSTPEEARQRAIERERAALANGWRPRTVAARQVSAGEAFTLYRPTGERINMRVINVERRGERLFSNRGHAFTHQLAGPAEYNLRATGESVTINPGDRVLFRQQAQNGEMIAALMVQEATVIYEPLSEYRPHVDYDLRCVQTAFEDGEQIAIQRYGDREQVILDLLDDPDPSIMHLYHEISKRVQEPADRPQVQQEILRRRAELQAAEIREREAAVSRERAAAEEAVRRTLPTRPRQQSIPPIQQDIQAAMRRLAGGQDLGTQKRRKIDLGE